MTYTRWGRTTCPTDTGAQLVYSGRTGGTHYETRGGSAENICLPDNPDYLAETAGLTTSFFSTVQGAEYELWSGPKENVSDHNVPCAVCYAPTRATTIMVPAKTTCPPSWTREYYGYLSTARDNHYRSSYTCIDNTPEVIVGTSVNEDPGTLFYHTISNCVGLLCPPYEHSRILSCAVCTK